MARLWQAGVFYPRWAPDLAFGLGYPLFHYHAPLFPWLATVGVWAGLATEDAIKLVLIGAAALGSVGVYGLARWWGLSEGGAAIAGLAYAYAPFRVRELYWQGDFPQLPGPQRVALGLVGHRSIYPPWRMALRWGSRCGLRAAPVKP